MHQVNVPRRVGVRHAWRCGQDPVPIFAPIVKRIVCVFRGVVAVVKGPTVYDVAERAGVSIATVSFAFSQPHRVKESTRDTVLDAARALGYVPSASARGLAKGRTGALGLFAFDFLNVLPDAEGMKKDRAAAVLAPNESCRLFPVWVDEVQRGVQLGELQSRVRLDDRRRQ